MIGIEIVGLVVGAVYLVERVVRPAIDATRSGRQARAVQEDLQIRVEVLEAAVHGLSEEIQWRRLQQPESGTTGIDGR
jgi:hypothetical protein